MKFREDGWRFYQTPELTLCLAQIDAAGVTDRKIRYFSVFRPCNLSLSRPLAMVYSSDALKNRLEPEAGTPIFQDALEWPVADEKPIFPSALPRVDAKRTAVATRFE
ncbi:hypothetical protein OE766_19285 [Pararhizobium sp. YC-54]|uniref:hypothetical protein n=1 Tax=Pararhizobium sp. YC-54 TaxID=2986920 RepID=UPI0021F7F39E|nr:hypothetical protein [Pararhizobium sp. YC-54]MCW0000375.1 hypothetical protein [Pararhizobium sp. YC-54]